MSACCENPEIMQLDYCEVCKNCCSLISDIHYEESFNFGKATPSQRIKKFTELLDSVELDWWLKQTLIDYFPKIERYFESSTRQNFINLPHLCRSMLMAMGYHKSAEQFTGLKTKARAKMVDDFVQEMFRHYGTSSSTTVELKDIHLFSPICGDIDMSKVVPDTHIYSDRTSINGIKSKAKAKIPEGRKRKAKN